MAMASRLTALALALMPLFLLCSCTPYQPAPKSWKERQSAVTPPALPHWWRRFEDENLSRSVELMFERNHDIHIYATRIDQAYYRLKSEESGRLPSVDLSTAFERSIFDTDDSTLSLSSRGTYEPDLWGRIEALMVAAQREFDAAKFDYLDSAATLSALFCSNWYALAYKKEQAENIESSIQTAQSELKLLEFRYKRGEATKTELISLQSTIEQMKNDLSTANNDISRLHTTLAILFGGKVDSPLPYEPVTLYNIERKPIPKIDTKAALFRSDVQSQIARLEAIDRRAAAAVAEQYPRVSLNIYIDGRELSFTEGIEEWFSTFSANLTAPLFDGKRRESDAKEALARRDEELFMVKKTILEATGEIIDALKEIKRARSALHYTMKRLELERMRTNLYRENFRHGQDSYDRYLEAKRGLLALQNDIAKRRYELIGAYIDFYRSTLTPFKRQEIMKESL